jgi:nucleoside-diphosphate-sugar epimerase
MSGNAASGGRPLITVLGASGFIGSAVTAALAERPIRLRIVARRPALPPPGGRAAVEVRTADLTARYAVATAVAGSDVVVHVVLDAAGWRGADGDARTERVNVGVMRDLVEALRCGRAPGAPPPVVVFAGSASQVGSPDTLPVDGTEADQPDTAYDRQKQSAEHLLRTATEHGVLRGVSLRLPTVFGPGPTATADRGVLSTMTRQALDGEALTMWHDGTVERDLLFVDDVATAFLAAIDHPNALAGRHWLLGTGRGERLGDVFHMIADLVATHTGRSPVPVVSVPPPDGLAVTDLRSMVVDSTAFRSATGWSPRVPLRDGLRRTVIALAGRPTP